MSREHGFISGWKKNATTTQEKSDNELDEPMVQYGGIMQDDESDEVQHLAVEARASAGPKRLGKEPLKVNSTLHSSSMS